MAAMTEQILTVVPDFAIATYSQLDSALVAVTHAAQANSCDGTNAASARKIVFNNFPDVFIGS